MDPFVKAAQKKLVAKGFLPAMTPGASPRPTGSRATRRGRRSGPSGASSGSRKTGRDQKTWLLLDGPGERAAGIVELRRNATPQGPDWNKIPTLAPVFPRQADVAQFYGDVGKHQAPLILPSPMKIAWDRAGLSIA